MANKLSIGLAVSLLLSGSFSGLAYADGGMSALEKQIMNGDSAPSAGNPDNFPWMNKDGSTKPATKSEAVTPAPTVSAPPPAPVREAAPVTPAATEALPHVPAFSEEKLRVEHAEAAPKIELEHPKAAETHTPAERTLEKTTARATERPTETAAAKKPTMLFGRIEQLSASAGASFPSLKAQTPMMDPRGVLVGRATATPPILSGVVRSFPDNYQGNWGGRLVLQQVQVDPNYYRIDPEEARRTVQAMKPGNVGQVNFNFDRSRGAIALEPARCLFMVPAGDTQVPDEMKKMLGGSGGNAAFGGMMSQMVSSMNVPIVLEFGDVQTSAGETSVSGNQMRQRVLKNETRQLASNVLEQQIVTAETTWDKRTHIARTGYGESVVRFTRQSPTVLYVQCATVSYDASKRFLEKMVLYGSIGKGVVMNTDPMQAMQGAMPGGMGGLGGLGGLQGMFGGGGGGGQTPTMPAGGLDGMLKNLFGGQ
ncbi:hypothetical protein BH10CYA1_BH10CYA1_40810 [soil metagenome]